MAGPQTIWGIDIGRCALKAVKLKLASGGRVELVGHDYVEHPKILSQPDANRDELISDALEKFLSRNDLSKDKVMVSVPGQHTLARFTKLPPVAPKKIPDIVRFEADQQIPFDMDEVIWDFQTFEQEDLPDVEVGIFAMKRELVREHLLYFEQASLEPVGVQSGPLAVYNALHFDGVFAGDTTILLDVGAESTDLIIATDRSLWTRSIAIGGNSFTDALVKSFKLSFTKAEHLKRTAATSKYARQVFQAMRPVFADLVQELQRSIGYYLSTHRDAEIEKIVGVGDAFQLPGLQKYLQQNLGMTVERPESFKKITAPDDSSFGEHLLGFAVAYGLALQGLELGKVTSNLLPGEIARQMVWNKKKPVFAAAAACLLLAGGLVWFRQSSDIGAVRAGGIDIDRVSINSLDQASSIIDSGPSSSLSPRARAQEVLLAGQQLKRELGKMRGSGEAEQQETEDLIVLQENKAVVPKILQTIHDSLPKLAGPLGQARTQAEVLTAIANDPTPRNQREVVFIESINMQYEQDLNYSRAGDWQENMIEADNEDVVYEDFDIELPGFFVHIVCTSPHEGGAEAIHDSFMKNLKDNGRRSETGFFINRVFLVEGKKIGAGGVSVSSRRGSRSSSPFSRAGGLRGTVREPEAGGLTAEGFDQYDASVANRMDPVTNEDSGQDWRFEIVLDVILEDMPEMEEDELGSEGGD